MRTVNQTLLDAIANQQGDTILRVLTWTDQADYTANPNAPDHTWETTKYFIGATSASAELITANDYTASAFTVFIIERGVKLAGVEYTIKSGLFFVETYQEDYGRIKIGGSSYPNKKISIAAGDGTYQQVIAAFCTAIGKTAVFKNSSDPWLSYQFLPTGKALSLNKAKLFENLIKQKYTLLVYEESPNNLVFYNQDSYSSSALKAVAENGSGELVTVATSGACGGLTSSTGADWTPRDLPSFYNDIVYSSSLALWVAVGASVAASSPDGITWTARTIPPGTYNSVAWSPSLALWVAVGASVAASSPDGITWTARTISAGNWLSIAWSPDLSLFVAHTSSKIATSSNGTTWSNNSPLIGSWSTSPIGANFWRSITWSAELSLFVAVGDNSIHTSPNAVTWTSRTPPNANSWTSVVWSSELTLFVAVSYDGTNRVMTSPNGITWTECAEAQANQWLSVTWSASLGLFVAVANTGINRVMYSSNGTSWSSASAAEANQWECVTWSPALGLFVAVSFDGTNRVMYSSNGTSWSSASITGSYFGVAWSPTLSLFVAVGSNCISTSSNGASWTNRTSPEANTWEKVAWSEESRLFFAISSDGTNRSMYSTNGIDWTLKVTAENNLWYSIAWSPALGLFVAVSGDGTTRAMKISIDYTNLKSCNWGNSIFVIVGASLCYTSSNGATWTSRTIPTGTYNGVHYSASLDLFAAVGSSVIATSPDGIAWTARTPASLVTWQDVVWSATLALFVAVASTGANRTMTSPDGIAWIGSTANADFDLSYADGTKSYLDRQQAAVHYVWRDESATLHTDGDTTLPQWNLGFLHSTASPPGTREDAYYKIFLQKAPVRLDLTDADRIHFTPYWSIDPTKTIDAMMQISEHLDLNQSPSWYQEIHSIVLFDNTEGGALPSTIERVAAYTPLASTGFDRNLTPDVNNLQALAQAVDDLLILPSALAPASAQYKYLVAGAPPFAYAESAGYLNISNSKTLAVTESLTLAASAAGYTLTVPGAGTALVKATPLTAGYIPFGVAGNMVGENAELFWDNTNKRLGIGTTTPTQKLGVAGSGNIALGYNYTGANSIIKTFATAHAADNVNSSLKFGILDGGDLAGIWVNDKRADSGAYNAQYISFYTHEGGVSMGERMRIDTRGNVGIGTTTIPSKLTVAGLINMKNYTVATLPAGTRGDIAYVTDGTTVPGKGAAPVGGGASVGVVFYNGAAWVGI